MKKKLINRCAECGRLIVRHLNNIYYNPDREIICSGCVGKYLSYFNRKALQEINEIISRGYEEASKSLEKKR